MKRRKSREAAFILLFENSFRNEDPEEIISAAMESELFDFGESDKDSAVIFADAEDIFKGVWEKKDELDKIIEGYSDKRQFGRIPKASVAILEIAIYESLYNDLVPVNAAINEAVLLAKKFAMEPDVQFINGVLGTFSSDLAKKEKSE